MCGSICVPSAGGAQKSTGSPSIGAMVGCCESLWRFWDLNLCPSARATRALKRRTISPALVSLSSPILYLLSSAQRSQVPDGPRLTSSPSLPPSMASITLHTLAAVVVGAGAPRRRWEGVGRWARAQSGDHLHDIGHDHLAGAHGFEPL